MNYSVRYARPGLLLLIAGFAVSLGNSTTAGGSPRGTSQQSIAASSTPYTSRATVQMPFASLNGTSSAYPKGTVAILGQPIVGECSNNQYRMRVGAIDGLVPLRPGDFNRDRRVTIEDWNQFADCFQGPDVPVSPQCRQGDITRDDDLDLADVAAFQRLFRPES